LHHQHLRPLPSDGVDAPVAAVATKLATTGAGVISRAHASLLPKHCGHI